MTETTERPASAESPTRDRGLSGMVLPELKALATQLGIRGTSGLRKGDLVAAIVAHRAGDGPASVRSERTAARGENGFAAHAVSPATSPSAGRASTGGAQARTDAVRTDAVRTDAVRTDAVRTDAVRTDAVRTDADGRADGGPESDRSRDGGRPRRARHGRPDADSRDARRAAGDGHRAAGDGAAREADRTAERKGATQSAPGEAAGSPNGADEPRQHGHAGDSRRDAGRRDDGRDEARRDDDDGSGDGGRRRGRRYRDRNRRGRERYSDSSDSEVRDDDVLTPISGIVDVLDSYAFVRTSGYLAGPKDVYVSMSQVRKHGLRRGDMITGAIRAPREGEQPQQRQKFNPLVRLDTINGLDPEALRNRPEFTKLTPLYPNQRLRLETESHLLTTRVIDLVMPVGKGQRALIVSPPKAGKTTVLQSIANAIAENNPECHLMVVLVDERPEEVTDMQRSVKGEVIASTFDRPPNDHTMVAELSIERAKRLVEMGRDVVVLLDSITRLGRAYNLAAPASGRILSGGVDSTALFPPKRFLGAARNIEDGGSLTIFASALVETGSAGDTVIFEEFKGTGNAELKLDRRLADKRLFPAIDLDASSTRKEELLLSPDELAVTVRLRRVLAALEAQQALELILDRLRKTRTNTEFLMTVAKNMPLTD